MFIFKKYITKACNSNCTGCSNATFCTGCIGSDYASRDPALMCACRSTAWNNDGTCTGIKIFINYFL